MEQGDCILGVKDKSSRNQVAGIIVLVSGMGCYLDRERCAIWKRSVVEYSCDGFYSYELTKYWMLFSVHG